MSISVFSKKKKKNVISVVHSEVCLWFIFIVVWTWTLNLRSFWVFISPETLGLYPTLSTKLPHKLTNEVSLIFPLLS